jgi:ABC-2 type transport system ATP-binding protein
VILRTEALGKAYGPHSALTDVNITVESGSVYGLVGPNGAGKTTLLSILAGLRHPTAGTVRLEVERGRVAVLPDTPQFETWLTGREVVALAAHLARNTNARNTNARNTNARNTNARTADARDPNAPDAGVSGDAVDAALADAGLSERADDRTGGYSRGMLQRLGLAATLVGQPQLLLLDEPASALDPSGRREVLDLIARLRGRTTIILSSHLLGDVQEVCDTIGILRQGRLLYQGPLDALLVGRAVPAYRVRLRPPVEPAVNALRAAPWVTGVEQPVADELRVLVTALADAEAHLPAVLATSGARVVSLAPAAPDLEDVFLELTS